MEKFYNMSVDAVMRDMKTDANGLSSAQAEERLAKYGQNKLAEAKKPGILKRFFMQLGDPVLIILLVAAGVLFRYFAAVLLSRGIERIY